VTETRDNILILKRFNGEERYVLSETTISCTEFEGLQNLKFDFNASEPAIQNSCPDTAEMSARPNGEFTVLLVSTMASTNSAPKSKGIAGT